MSPGWGRTAQRHFESHRTWITEAVHITQSTSTHWTPWRGDQALHKHSVFCSKTNQLDKVLTTRYTSIKWTWYHTPRALASGHRNCSWFDSWKQNQTCWSQVKKFNIHLNHRGYCVRQISGLYQGLITIKNL